MGCNGGVCLVTKVTLAGYPDEALLFGRSLGHIICGGRCGRTASGVLLCPIVPEVEFVDEVCGKICLRPTPSIRA